MDKKPDHEMEEKKNMHKFYSEIGAALLVLRFASFGVHFWFYTMFTSTITPFLTTLPLYHTHL